jgi:hypothetical protein
VANIAAASNPPVDTGGFIGDTGEPAKEGNDEEASIGDVMSWVVRRA